ncbi:hypothetical protein [Actinacidiphila acididurans]|uniref:DUF222 domain-containing protein n=1 Tax=Actinacidiphila acididurans TaxID=2784346 RepID=A0ABS2U3Q8_9ACTN|nr:hypothetical protein [Actinacidiphila acididurans]MBM9509967.1 hypothetical protein [Actinacidiphila acididurans]
MTAQEQARPSANPLAIQQRSIPDTIRHIATKITDHITPAEQLDTRLAGLAMSLAVAADDTEAELARITAERDRLYRALADVDLRSAIAAAAHTVLAGAGPQTLDEWTALVADAVLPVVRSRLASTVKERDGAYRERNALAALAAGQAESAVVAPATDVPEPGWQILYLVLHGRQCSWHFGPRDADLIEHLEHVPADDPRAQWDGHTTEAKYEHIAWIARALGTPGPFRKPDPAKTTERGQQL